MTGKTARPALADHVHAVLLERILDQHYQPRARLNIDALSRELDISASPVREALNRLTAEGLVSSSSYSGFAVAPVPSREWFENLLEYRILNEGYAARLAARSRSEQCLSRMAQSLEALRAGNYGPYLRDYQDANRADEAFHTAMLEAANNDILLKAVRDLRPHLHHARLFSRVAQDVAAVVSEHTRIFDAVAAGDEDAAAQALEAHLRTSWRRYDGWDPQAR